MDGVEADTVLKVAQEQNMKVEKILTTHHHSDHSSGNISLKKLLSTCQQKVQVYGFEERIEGLDHFLQDGERIEVGETTVEVLHLPFHTSGHLGFLGGKEGERKALFSGDVLFVASCGRFFEGTAAQAHQALNVRIGSLPDDTLLFCGHEYTLSNLHFASFLEPHNKDVKEKLEWAKKRREEEEPTIPSTLGEEKKYNPFLRTHLPHLKASLNLPPQAHPITVMASLRKAKNEFIVF